MPGRTKRTFHLEDLKAEIPNIFDQAQQSTANHQKNYIALHKLHLEAAQVTETTDRGMAIKLIGERTFEEVFMHMVARILPIKKGVTPVDRVAKFVGGYTKYVNEKAAEEAANRGDRAGDEDEDESTAARYTAHFLRFLFKGCAVKDKAVRQRVLQLIAEMISHLGEIDENIYLSLRSALLGRIYDKEPSVRVQAVIALSRLSGSEDPADAAEGDPTLTEVLIDILSYDPSAEVRRVALANIVRDVSTLPAILSRTRDTDATIRKLVYSTILDPKSQPSEVVAAVHPRALSIAQRELIVRNGLGDREESVKSAAERLVNIWAELVKVLDDDQIKSMENEEHAVENDLITFLKMFDLSECKVAEDAVLCVLRTQRTIFDKVKFGDAYWLSLTPEKAFLARVYVEHCLATQNDAKLESALPVVTALAFKIQSTYNDLLEDIQMEEEERLLRDLATGDGNGSEKEEQKMEKELVIDEMLKLAVNLDYTDEIGRRKMFQLTRDMVSQDVLPEPLVARCLDVLRTLSNNERDFIRVVVEVVHDLRDPSEEDVPKVEDAESQYDGTPSASKPAPTSGELVTEKTPDEIARTEAIDIRCLSLCIGMLERVNGRFEENSTLEGILRELILPAVTRKDLVLREKGLVSLGLCCLIARRMALGSFQLLLGQIQSAPDVIKIPVLQIVFDILMVHDSEFLGKKDETAENILKFLLNSLGREESPKVQALISIGLAKLLLSGIISDERVLTSLLMTYLSPLTTDNHELRQAMSYFFPVYCYSSSLNQRCVQKIFTSIFEKLLPIRKDLDEDEEMVSSGQVGDIFLDWTDPQKALALHGQELDDTIHFNMASDIIKTLFKKELTKEDKRALCQLLGKLHLPDKIDDYKLICLKVLMHHLNSRRPLHDTAAKNAFTRFDAVVSKKYSAQLENFNEEEYRKLAELKDLFDFLDDIIPEDDEEIEIKPQKSKSVRKRRSQSIVSQNTDEISFSSRPIVGKGKTKKRRISTSDDESNGTDEPIEVERFATSPPRRTLPQRAVKKPVEVIEISDDDDFVPQPPRITGTATYKIKKEDASDMPKARQSHGINAIASPSSVESSDEEEMHEVDGLLVDD